MLDRAERIARHIESLWTPQTSIAPERWSDRTPESRAIGQSIVSALVLRDWLDGSLVQCLRITGRAETLHVYNSLPGGVLDITGQYRRIDEELLVNICRAEPLDLLQDHEVLRAPYEVLGSAMIRRLKPELPPFAFDPRSLGAVMEAPNQAVTPPTAS